ncbi:MAG: hypothetical protein Q3996_01090 [Candidatus Saccharibacteria bacterium]|nr:hypothetical protein [Candidatus Saccharibacteria bacterium]
MPGKNNERRNYAYLSRLNSLIEKYGDNLEQRLWQASTSKAIIKPEDITDKYWKQQEQILRNEGQGRTLSNYEKDYLTKEIIAEQERTITPWVNYLSDKDCPYPTWFKVYAFDGLSRMGLYNDKTKEFEKRDKHTIGSFPNLNPEVLAKVYSHINDFFSQDSSAWFEKHPEDEKLSVLVKSGNFNKLYSKELLETKVIMKTPERTEDIHGDWFEYKLGDEEQISRLAEGTRWCIADPHTANNYLSLGTYNDDGIEDDDYDDYDDDNYKDNNHNDNKARFFIFRLKTDQSKDGYADNGSASIRLTPDGNVAEVSGLKDGQALEDALVPIVQEKVLSLPGGEKYNQRFADKQELIRLDKKMQENQDLTKEELEFIYELNRNITTLDTYNNDDPRIQELKDRYNVQYILDHDIEIDFNKLVERLDSYDIAENLDTLINHGIDANILVKGMNPSDIVKNLNTLINHGADIDVNELVKGVDSGDIVDNLDTLINHGVDANILVKRMQSSNIVNNLDTLINHGVDANILVENMDPSDIVENLNTLINHGADANILTKKMGSSDIAKNLDTLIDHGVIIDVNELSKNMNSSGIVDSLDILINHGADINILVENMNPYDISRRLDTLINHGADVNAIVSEMSPSDIAENREKLLAYGANLPD